MSDCCMSDTPNVSVKNCFAIDVLKSVKDKILKQYNANITAYDMCSIGEVINIIDKKIAELNGGNK